MKKTRLIFLSTVVLMLALAVPAWARTPNYNYRKSTGSFTGTFNNFPTGSNFPTGMAQQQANAWKDKLSNQKWQELKAQFRAVNKPGQYAGVDIEQKKQEFFARAKERFALQADKLLAHLNALKTRLSENENIDQATKARLTGMIDEEIAWVNANKSRIESAQSPEDIKSLVNELRARWESRKGEVKEVVGHIIAARIDKAIAKAEELVARAEDKIAELKASGGYDTSSLESALASARQDLQSAKAEALAARDIFDNIDADNAQEQFQLGREHLKKAAEYIKSALQTVREALKDLKQMAPSLAPSLFPSTLPTQFQKPTVSVSPMVRVTIFPGAN